MGMMYTRRRFLTISATMAAAASATAMFGCSSKDSDAAANDNAKDAKKQEDSQQEEPKAKEPGTSADNPIKIKLGDTIHPDDAALTIESNDGFAEELRGTDPTFSLKIESGKVALLVRCSLYYEGKSEARPENCLVAQVLFDGDYKYKASVNDTESIVKSISPLETRGITLCAQIPEDVASQLTNPVLILRAAKRFDPTDKSKDTVYYRCPLS